MTIHLPFGGSTAARTLGCPAWHRKSENLPRKPAGAAADDGDDGGIFAGQIFGGHPAGGAGTKLAGSASFDDGLELAGGSR